MNQKLITKVNKRRLLAPLESSSEEGSDDYSDFDPQADDSPSNRRQGQIRHHSARGRGRGRAHGRGRGRGRTQAVPPAAGNAYQSYNTTDSQYAATIHTKMPARVTSGRSSSEIAMTRAVDFFCLFITAELLREICEHTNSYGWLQLLRSPPTVIRMKHGMRPNLKISKR